MRRIPLPFPQSDQIDRSTDPKLTAQERDFIKLFFMRAHAEACGIDPNTTLDEIETRGHTLNGEGRMMRWLKELQTELQHRCASEIHHLRDDMTSDGYSADVIATTLKRITALLP